MDQICEVVIDQAGNIKLPDALLLAAGLRPGIKMLIHFVGHGELRLCPQNLPADMAVAAAPPELVEEAGHLFLRGVKPFEIDKLIEEDREARIRELMEGIKL